MRPVPLTLLAALAASAVGLVLAAPAEAAPACSTVLQVTDATGGFSSGPSITPDGGLVAFKSNRDLTGDNADLNVEVFLYDTDADTLEQITDSTGSAAVSSPSISENGRIAFSSDRDYLGTNPEGNEEIFVWNGTALSQRTSSADESTSSEDPEISGNGSTVAFVSTAELTGSNPLGVPRIFRVNSSGTPSITSLTSSAAQNSTSPSINDDGTRIAFISFADLVPATGNSDHNRELFVVDPAGPTTVQLTNTTDDLVTASPDMTDDGTRVFFQSQQDLVGQNASHETQLFRRVIAGATTQVTHVVGGAASTPVIDATGARVTFVGNGDALPGSTPSSSDVYVTDGTANGVSAVTDVPNGQSASGSVLSDDGRVLAFSSNGDFLASQNGDHSQELFLARCGSETRTWADVPTTNAFSGPIEWMAQAGIAPVPANHRFHPADPTTRQQTAVFLYRLAGQPPFTPPSTPTFTDVGLGNGARRQIEWMAAEGIVTVPANHRFHPADALTRRQMANFLFNLAGQPLFVPPGSPTFSDVPASNPSFLQIEWAAAELIVPVPANHLFHPTDAVKRQQMANFLHNFAVFSAVDLA